MVAVSLKNKQKTAYEISLCDWSSDVCSSDLLTYVNASDRAHAVVGDIERLGRRALALRADSADAEAVVAAVDRAGEALGRYAAPEDIAATVAHLAGESGRAITGASIAVDGGFAA